MSDTIRTIGDDSPWHPLFSGLEDGTEVAVKVVTNPHWHYEGRAEGVATWDNLEETVRYQGVVVTTPEGISHWIPFDLITGVELG